MVNQVIGLDIGHSSVKAIGINAQSNLIKIFFPSVVVPSTHISYEPEAKRAAAETVIVNGKSFFIGETAKIQGRSTTTTGLSEDWIHTDEHTALFLGAISKLKNEGVLVSGVMLVLGLPAALYSRYAQDLKKIAQGLVDAEVRVLPQPMGPYQAIMVDEEGNLKEGRSMTEESWGVVEVGHFTTDFMLMQEARWIEKASALCSGVRVASEHLSKSLGAKGLSVDALECDEALRLKYVKNYGEKLDVSKEVGDAINAITTEVIDAATRLIEPYARRLDGVIVAGGGAPLVIAGLKDKWPNAVLAEDSRFSVAEGFRRWGLSVMKSRKVL